VFEADPVGKIAPDEEALDRLAMDRLALALLTTLL